MRRMLITLIMTEGISLAQWRDSGLLYRELSLYEKLFEEYDIATQIITYGNKQDIDIIKPYNGLTVLCNKYDLPMDQYIRYLPWLHYHAIRKSMLLKTNQVKGAEITKNIADITGIQVLARCGYVQSEIMNNDAMYNEQLHRSVMKSEKILFELAKIIVVTTNELKQYIVQKHHITEQSIKVIPNFVDTDIFTPILHKNTSNRKKILFIGRFTPQKNLINFITACEGIDADIQLIGQGIQQDEIVRLAQKINISLTITPPVPNHELPKYLHQADIFILVSHSEGNPKTLIEAMSCGLPVLCANSPGISNIIRHGVDGWLCETDSASIHTALTKLLSDEDLCKSIAEKARETIVNNNSLHKIVTEEYATYNELTELTDIPTKDRNITHNLLKLSSIYFNTYIYQVRLKLSKTRMKHEIKSLLSKLILSFSCLWIARPWFLHALSTQKPKILFSIQKYASNNVVAKEETKSVVINHINNYLQNSSPTDSLSFLFELDNWIYTQEGKKCIEYNYGLHTKHRHMNYYRFFIDHVQNEQSIIDLGCGNGALTSQVARKTKSLVMGIDFSENNIITAKENFQEENITYQFGNIYYDLPEQHFDTVIMSNVLEHLDNRIEILQIIMQKLSPNQLLIRVPLFERDWRVPLKKELGIEFRLDPTHFIEYTQETFEDEITQAGLMIESQETRWGEIWAVIKTRK